MSAMITLSKKFGMKKSGRHFEYHYDDKFLSNGEFLINKCLVKNVYDYLGNPEARYGGGFDRIMPQLKDCREWTKTQIIYSMCVHGFARVYIQKELNLYALINEKYIECFDLGNLQGTTDTNPFCNFEQTIVVMPMRSNGFTEHLKELMALVSINKTNKEEHK